MGEMRTKLGYEDYCLIPEDGKRHEIVDGEHYVSPSPLVVHQRVSMRLSARLFAAVDDTGLAEVFAAPIDVQLSDHDIVQPDLVVVLPETRRYITPTKIKGPPDLLVEILSPSTRVQDRKRKKRLYERRGVREFWIVDPSEQTVEQFVLAAARYERGELHGDLLTLAVLPQVTIDFASVW